MHKSIICGTILTVSLCILAQAQAQTPVPAQLTPAMMLQDHWEPGDQIFDAQGRWIGMLGQINQDGTVVMWGANSNPTRTLRAGSLRWTGEELVAN